MGREREGGGMERGRDGDGSNLLVGRKCELLAVMGIFEVGEPPARVPRHERYPYAARERRENVHQLPKS